MFPTSDELRITPAIRPGPILAESIYMPTIPADVPILGIPQRHDKPVTYDVSPNHCHRLTNGLYF